MVVVDEIQKIHTDASGEAMAALKMYLESGRYRRAAGDMGTSEAGFVMLGNIALGMNRLPLYESDGIFKELPAALQESAFVDRIHGLIEGWYMPRVSRNTPSKSLGFKGDFFSEVLHELRVDLRYADCVSRSLELPRCEDMRDTKAVCRLAEGFLKLLFPHLEPTEEDFVKYCVNPAVRMRQQIRDELSKIDREYKWVTIKSRMPDEFQLSHPEERPNAEEEKRRIDPLSPERAPQPGTVDIAEGQKGISYEKLFLPFLKDAKSIKIRDPYIRLQYQIYNLMNFCEIIEPKTEKVAVDLITGCDPYQSAELGEKLDELKKGLAADDIARKTDWAEKNGVVAFLRTWDQRIPDRLYLHCIVPAGATSEDVSKRMCLKDGVIKIGARKAWQDICQCRKPSLSKRIRAKALEKHNAGRVVFRTALTLVDYGGIYLYIL